MFGFFPVSCAVLQYRSLQTKEFSFEFPTLKCLGQLYLHLPCNLCINATFPVHNILEIMQFWKLANSRVDVGSFWTYLKLAGFCDAGPMNSPPWFGILTPAASHPKIQYI